MSFADELRALKACEEAIDWVGDRAAQKAWDECQRPEWLIWLAGHSDTSKATFVSIACEIARTVLHLVPADEHRPRLAIEAAEAWVADPCERTMDASAAASAAACNAECNAAWDAAWDAALSAASAAESAAACNAAWNAAWDAALFASSAAAIAAAIDAASAAASAATIKAAIDGARAAESAAACAIIRRHIPVCSVGDAQ